jgi:hypothetical protein
VSARNVDEALGWIREEFKKIGVKYAYIHSVQSNDWYPHYIHNLGVGARGSVFAFDRAKKKAQAGMTEQVAG